MKPLRSLSMYRPYDRACNKIAFFYASGTSIQAASALLGVPEERLAAAASRELSALIVIARWNMRAGEYLALVENDVLGNDMVLVRGEKKSASYQIYLPGIEEQLRTDSDQRPGRLVAGTSYARLYRMCTRIGYGKLIEGHKNLAKTHLARYINSSKINRFGGHAVSDCLHHRSEKNRDFYLGARR